MFNTNLPIMKRSIYQPAIGCSCWLHTWPTLLQSLYNQFYSNKILLQRNFNVTIFYFNRMIL